MRAEFDRLRTCDSCVAAGYGWCPNLRRCGGFANKRCGIGPNYVSSAPQERNGIWQSKKARAAEEDAPPAADVPSVSPPPAAGLLYAKPIQAAVTATAVASTGDTSANDDGEREQRADQPTNTTAAAHLSNRTRIARDELLQLPIAALVDKIIELSSENAMLRGI